MRKTRDLRTYTTSTGRKVRLSDPQLFTQQAHTAQRHEVRLEVEHRVRGRIFFDCYLTEVDALIALRDGVFDVGWVQVPGQPARQVTKASLQPLSANAAAR